MGDEALSARYWYKWNRETSFFFFKSDENTEFVFECILFEYTIVVLYMEG